MRGMPLVFMGSSAMKEFHNHLSEDHIFSFAWEGNHCKQSHMAFILDYSTLISLLDDTSIYHTWFSDQPKVSGENNLISAHQPPAQSARVLFSIFIRSFKASISISREPSTSNPFR
jgi:hypothetical protein